MGELRRLIVFDLDGTLIDSRRDLADAANALIVERGGAPLSEDAIGRMVGEGARVLVERALSAAGLAVRADSLTRFLDLYDERLLNTTRPYEGIPEAMRELAVDGVIAVLTNKPTAPSLRLLEALGLAPLVAVTLGGDGPFPRKPDPAALLHLMSTLDVTVERTILIGDSWIDHQTAARAGTAVCLARYGFGFETFPTAELRGHEAVADAPTDLPAAVRRAMARAPNRAW